ncbi:MAG: hypothetical protein AAGH89_16655, partial [Verrucomicrobiota bacterium]
MKALKATILLLVVGIGLFVFGLWLWQGYPMYKIRKEKVSEIEFYGRITGEDGHPIEGVSLIAECDTYPENLFAYFFTGSADTYREELISDSDGTFAV